MRDSSRRSDETLVRAARGGDRAAFGTLVERYHELICAIAYGRTGDVEIAHDIAKRIEEEMQYPGEVRVTLIRELRCVEYAR